MSSEAKKESDIDTDKESSIRDYLSSHNDFFERHLDLLANLHIPHAPGAAISLIEKQVSVLRKDKEELQIQLEELVNIARENELLNQRLHRLTLTLIEAATFEEMMTMLQDELHDEFQADAVEIRLFSPTHLDDHLQTATGNLPEDAELMAFQGFFDKKQPMCGPLSKKQLDYLFGAEATDIQSAALIPLQAEGVLGMLAIGSHDRNRFHANKGTDFLIRLGDIVGRTLQVVSLPGV